MRVMRASREPLYPIKERGACLNRQFGSLGTVYRWGLVGVTRPYHAMARPSSVFHGTICVSRGGPPRQSLFFASFKRNVGIGGLRRILSRSASGCSWAPVWSKGQDGVLLPYTAFRGGMLGWLIGGQVRGYDNRHLRLAGRFRVCSNDGQHPNRDGVGARYPMRSLLGGLGPKNPRRGTGGFPSSSLSELLPWGDYQKRP